MRLGTFLGRVLVYVSSFALYGDWNKDFEEKTNYLIEQIPALQEGPYWGSYIDFLLIRNSLLQNKNIKKAIAKTPLEDKVTLLDSSDSVVIKKRRNNHIHELFAWEVACLIGGADSILASFPLEIEGKKVILQAKKAFTFGKGKLEMPSSQTVKKVSLETYWKAHFCAYLLGIADLVSKNIGIGNDGKIIFFDAEASFCYYNKPFRTESGFSTGFLLASFDWPQYEKPLDARLVRSLQNFVANLSNIEDLLKLYEEVRGFSFLSEDFAYRLDKVRSFRLEEGLTFQDFFTFIYPKLGLGLDKLGRRVSQILERKVGHGVALIFMNRSIYQYSLSSSQKKSLEHWLDTYIE